MMDELREILAPLAALATPEAVAVLDIAVLAALAVMIVVGVVVGRRLKELHAARAEWAQELAEFSKKADAAEEGLSRLRALLLAEADRRHAAHNQAIASTRASRPSAGVADFEDEEDDDSEVAASSQTILSMQ